MTQADRVLSTPPITASKIEQQTPFQSTDISELSLRLRLRKAGMRLERRGRYYRLMAGAQVLLDKGPCGHGLTLKEVARFTHRALLR
jgi:hypothetical protein